MGENNPLGFLKGTIEELKKVTWPTKKEIISNTTVVLIAVAFCATLIWVIDTFFSFVFRWILQ